jgi:hypothetical protein
MRDRPKSSIHVSEGATASGSTSSLSDLGDAQQFPNRVRLEVDASADWGFRRGWMIA